MPFPIVHGVVAASLFIGLQRKLNSFKDWKLVLLSAALSILPDADFVLDWIFQLHVHRGFTHSIAFGVAVGLLASVLFGARKFSHRLALVLAPTSHALLDFLVTNRMGNGIQLLWPLSDYRFRLGLFDYFLFRFDPRVDPWSEISIQVIKISLVELIVMGPPFLLLIYLKLRKQNQHSGAV